MRRINDEEKKYLLSLKPEDITYELGMSLFANHVEKRDGKVVEVPSKFEPTDFFLLKAGEYFNKEDVETTVGSFIFNKFIIEPRFSQYIDYVNFEITDDKYSVVGFPALIPGINPPFLLIVADISAGLNVA